MKKNKRFISIHTLLLIAMVMFYSASFAQFGLDKVKKTADGMKKDQTTTECKAVNDLKTRFKLIKEVLNSKDFTFWKMHHDHAVEYIKEIKEKCTTVDPKPFEDELKGYEKQYEELSASTQKDQKSKEEAEKELQQANYDIDNLMYMNNIYKGMLGKKDEAQKFYDQCKKIDYPVRKPKIEKYAQEIPDFKREGYEQKGKVDRFLIEFPKKLEQLINDFIVNEINMAIENAYSEKAKGKSSLSSALAYADAALTVSNGILLIDPNHSKMLQLKKDAQAIYDKIDSEIGTSVYTSKFHKENAGKLLLSKSPIVIKSEKADAMTDKFKAGEYIYGMFYLKGTFKELTQGGFKLIQKIEVDGEEKISRRFELQDEKRDWTYLTTEIVADPKTSETKGVIEYSKALSVLSPRMHKIKVSLIEDFGSNEVLAEGEFELDCTEGMDKLEKITKDLKEKEFKTRMMPKAGIKDAKLEKEMLAAVSDWKEKPLRAVVISNEWTINRNALTGIIEYRSIQGAVAFKTAEGECKIFYLSFRQDSKGKSYGKTQSWGVGDNEIIPCENVNK